MHDIDNEFRIVTNKKKKNTRRKSYLTTVRKTDESSDSEILGVKLKERLRDLEVDVSIEIFYSVLLEVLRNRSINRLVCLGLGHFSSCPISRVQLALVIALAKSVPISDIVLQDPVFSQSEQIFLRELGYSVLVDNVEGRFFTEKDQHVLYFLPHCPKALTNNLLAANWNPDRLANSIIVCNSFQALLTNTLERDIKAEAIYVRKISGFTIETPLSVTGKHFDSFNDTSIHIFPKTELNRITEDSFWQPCDTNESEDLELISNQLEEQLNI